MQALEFFNQPASTDFITQRVAKLRAVMARRSENDGDLAVMIDTYAEHLEQYPPDAVAFVVDRTIAGKKWLPLISELRAELDAIVALRRAILEAFRTPNAKLLEKTAARKSIAADPRLSKSFDQLESKNWLPQHWIEWVRAGEEMAKLAQQNPHFMDFPAWTEIAAARRSKAIEQGIEL